MFYNQRLDTNIKHIYVFILKNIFDTKQTCVYQSMRPLKR